MSRAPLVPVALLLRKMDLTLTPATEADREFLYELYRATMREYIERTWGWDEAWQRAGFEQRLAKGLTRTVTPTEAGREP